jgi:hypothetical protein
MPGRSTEPIEPMTLGNMRRLGVRSIEVACPVCRHEATFSAEPWPDDVPVPAFGPRMVYTRPALVFRHVGRRLAEPLRLLSPFRFCGT